MPIDTKTAARFAAAKVLVVDDEHFMRKVVHTLLTSIGIGAVFEAADGLEGLDVIRQERPDAAIVDWNMPKLDGPGFVRLVRSPLTFSYPDIPIVMLTGHGERSRVIEALQLGVNEYLLKPVSGHALQERLVAVLTNPRPIVQRPGYYGPEPRTNVGGIHADNDKTIALLG
jgi:CheY-like chemotaxis protein